MYSYIGVVTFTMAIYIQIRVANDYSYSMVNDHNYIPIVTRDDHA